MVLHDSIHFCAGYATISKVLQTTGFGRVQAFAAMQHFFHFGQPPDDLSMLVNVRFL